MILIYNDLIKLIVLNVYKVKLYKNIKFQIKNDIIINENLFL